MGMCARVGDNVSARMRRRPALAALLATVAAILALGCGDDDATSAAPAGQQPFLSLSEVESELERRMLAIVRTGGGDTSGDREGLVDLVRYEDQSSREFEIFVWTSPRVARQQRSSLLAAARAQHGRDATAIRAANVIAVFPDAVSSVDAYSAATNAMSRLAAACVPGGETEQRLRRLCFGDEAVPPPGEGVDRDEAEEANDTIVLDGMRYDPLIARRLNPNIAPDEELVSGRRPPAGTSWFGVFLRVCNEREGEARTPSGRVALVDASGARREPSELPANNPFDYDPQPIRAQSCLPRESSVAEQLNGGALVLFAVSKEYLSNRPIALEVTGDGDAPRRMRVVLEI